MLSSLTGKNALCIGSVLLDRLEVEPPDRQVGGERMLETKRNLSWTPHEEEMPWEKGCVGGPWSTPVPAQELSMRFVRLIALFPVSGWIEK